MDCVFWSNSNTKIKPQITIADNNRDRGIEGRATNNQTQLFREPELLRNENFQFLLRVYNAQQLVGRLTTVLERDRKTNNGIDTNSESTDIDSDSADTDDSANADVSSDHAESGTSQNNAAAKATAEEAVRTIHDLNRRLMALMATVSAKLLTSLETIIEEEEGVGSEVTCLQRQCRPERPVMQQLMTTEQCPRNRELGKFEQQRCMTQGGNTSSDCSGSSISQNNEATKATTESAVRTIHDLLTLNWRLLILMKATVLDKSVSISADNKRRWRELRSLIIEKYTVDGQNKKNINEDKNHDDEFYDTSAMDSETFCKAQILLTERSVTGQNVLRSLSQPLLSIPLQTVSEEDEGIAYDVTSLRGQFRPIRPVQQLMKKEQWAQNQKYFGEFEQKWFTTQVAYVDDPRDRRPLEQISAAIAVAPQLHRLQEFRLKAATSAKRILVIQSAAKAPEAICTKLQTAGATSPPVLQDNSEVDFFFSCAEEDDDDDDCDCRENFAEVNCTSSSKNETSDWTDCRSDEETVQLAAIGAPVASSMRSWRHCRPHHRQPHPPIKSDGNSARITMTTSSSMESVATDDEADESNGDGIITTKTIAAARRYGTASVGRGSIKRRRGMLPRRCFSGGLDAAAEPANRPRPPSVADAQVQFGELSGDRGDSELQLLQLRRELDEQRRENDRLNDMLLRFQREIRPGDQEKGDSGPNNSVQFPDLDPSDSPKPSRLASGAVHCRNTKLFSSLLSSTQQISDDDIDGGYGDHQRYRQDGVEQQMQLLVYKPEELDGHASTVLQQLLPEDPLNDVFRRMNQTDLVKVGLPLVVKRLHRALVLLQHRSENFAAK